MYRPVFSEIVLSVKPNVFLWACEASRVVYRVGSSLVPAPVLVRACAVPSFTREPSVVLVLWFWLVVVGTWTKCGHGWMVQNGFLMRWAAE